MKHGLLGEMIVDLSQIQALQTEEPLHCKIEVPIVTGYKIRRNIINNAIIKIRINVAFQSTINEHLNTKKSTKRIDDI